MAASLWAVGGGLWALPAVGVEKAGRFCAALGETNPSGLLADPCGGCLGTGCCVVTIALPTAPAESTAFVSQTAL